MKELNICLLGLSFFSANYGCGALAYSFLDLLLEAVCDAGIKLNLEIVATSKCGNIESLRRKNISSLHYTEYHFKHSSSRRLVKRAIDKADLIVDFTEGDSFTDIYGVKRWIATTYPKYYSIKNDKRLVLGPQTYGPYNNKIIEKASAWIVKNAFRVYSRDSISTDYIKQIADENVNTVTDVAFGLEGIATSIKTSIKKHAGINISGLLWNEGYSMDNQFGLTVDYKAYCREIIKILSKDYEVYLIPHVCSNDRIEGDIFVSKELQKEFPEVTVLESNNPMQAKGYIGAMDLFIGARMHSTIAAISQGVAVIPFSYSRKFQGLFSSLDYPFYVDGRAETTEGAIEKTRQYIDKEAILTKNAIESCAKGKESLKAFQLDIKQMIERL